MTESASHGQVKDIIELKKQHVVPEERMKTLLSDLQGTLARFRADTATGKPTWPSARIGSCWPSSSLSAWPLRVSEPSGHRTVVKLLPPHQVAQPV